jgi:hypothetical protein
VEREEALAAVRADKDRKQQEVGIIRGVELKLESKVDKLKAQRGEEAAKVKCADKEVATLSAKMKEYTLRWVGVAAWGCTRGCWGCARLGDELMMHWHVGAAACRCICSSLQQCSRH